MKSLSNLYKLINVIAAFGWGILIFLPRWNYTDIVIKNGIVVGLSMFYIYLIFIRKDIKNEEYPKGNFTSLEGILNLFKNPRNLLSGWVHYLAFDLMLGIYIKSQANEIGMSHFLQIPCFILTFLLGPVGYLLFIVLQLFLK
jgi:hypothetical protein